MCCTVECLHLLRNRCRNVGGKLRCHNIIGIMQTMSVVPGGKLYFFLQHLCLGFVERYLGFSCPKHKRKQSFNYLVYTKETLLLQNYLGKKSLFNPKRHKHVNSKYLFASFLDVSSYLGFKLSDQSPNCGAWVDSQFRLIFSLLGTAGCMLKYFLPGLFFSSTIYRDLLVRQLIADTAAFEQVVLNRERVIFQTDTCTQKQKSCAASSWFTFFWVNKGLFVLS